VEKNFFITILTSIFLFTSFQAAWGQSEHTAKLIEGAKKEGEVIVYGTMSLEAVNLLNARFREKYPYVDVKLNRLGSGKFVPRVLAEVRANKHLADVLQTNSLSLHFLKRDGLLANYLSPEDRFYPKQFKDQGYWTTTNMNVHVLAYNTKLIARGKAPRSYDEVLNPVWKGKMMMDASEQWAALMFQIMGKEKAQRYMRELVKQNIALRRESNAMRAQLIAAGEAPMDIDSTLGPVDELKKRGAPIDWNALSPVPVVTSAHAIASRPPHPNAARLYLDFILSREGQKAVLDTRRQVARTDLLSEQEAIKNLDLVPLDPLAGSNMDYYAKLIKEIFQQ
jgi:ABC-type Fe3+ transport system substrate-binding protein